MASIIKDLKVEVQSKTLVFPAEKTERRTKILTKLDQFYNFYPLTVDFFSGNKDFPIEIVIEKLKNALSKLFVYPYDYVCGRLKTNPNNGCLEVDVNGSGYGFVVASSGVTLDEIGDLVYPNPAFRRLIVSKIDTLSRDDQPLFIIQITSFKCGGFAMGIAYNHVLFDGYSGKIFLENFVAVLAGKPLAIIPCTDHNLLAPRSPPRVTFPHPELIEVPIGEEKNLKLFENSYEDLVHTVFLLSSDDIAKLKAKATVGNSGVSTFNVATAHIWRCYALMRNDESDYDKVTSVGYIVDVRRRMNPPLPATFSGNALLTAYAAASCKELRDEPFSKIVDMVLEGTKRINEEYVRSTLDCFELYNRVPYTDFMVSSWMRFNFQDLVYPWGIPKFSGPVAHRKKNIIVLFPDVNGGSNSDGVNVLVNLPKMELAKFQKFHHEFLQG